MANYDPTIRVDTIVSGKLRRYHALPWWQQAMRLRTIVVPNIRDSFKVMFGIGQAIFKMILWRPNLVFTKGGFVCLPIGLAARVLRIPLVIHDSDAHPGLTNRVLARWADRILTGAPLEYYPYPRGISRHVGIPIQVELEDDRLTAAERKLSLALHPDRHLIVCTGGGLGASRINAAVLAILPQLLEHNCQVVLITGEKNYQQTMTLLGSDVPQYLTITPFISGNLHEYFAAADVVVTRAGATTLLELAALARPTIIIPNIHLTGGHQRKNAAVYADSGAAIVVDEVSIGSSPEALADAVIDLVDNPERRAALSRAIHQHAKPDAARETVDIIVDVLKEHGEIVS